MSKESSNQRRERLGQILVRLQAEYPDAKISLRYSNALELLAATILSAQCTDRRVNEVTRKLFLKYRTAGDYARAEIEELEAIIRPTGFYHNKANALIGCCRQLEERFEGRVPESIEELTSLPGIGRKTANVLLGNVFNIPAVIVDTHVKRLSQRLGLTVEKVADRIEQDLMTLCPRDSWTRLSNLLIDHGRAICKSRKPRCGDCVICASCPSSNTMR